MFDRIVRWVTIIVGIIVGIVALVLGVTGTILHLHHPWEQFIAWTIGFGTCSAIYRVGWWK